MSLKYEPSSEPLHISAKWLFLNRELYRAPWEPRLAADAGTGQQPQAQRLPAGTASSRERERERETETASDGTASSLNPEPRTPNPKPQSGLGCLICAIFALCVLRVEPRLAADAGAGQQPQAQRLPAGTLLLSNLELSDTKVYEP